MRIFFWFAVTPQAVIPNAPPVRYYNQSRHEEEQRPRGILKNNRSGPKEGTLEKRKESWSVWSKSSDKGFRPKSAFGGGAGASTQRAGNSRMLNDKEWTWPGI